MHHGDVRVTLIQRCLVAAGHGVVPLRQREHLETLWLDLLTLRLLILLRLLAGLPVDVLEGQFWDVHLFLLQRNFLLFEEDLGALVAALQVHPALVQVDLACGLWRLVLVLLDGDALTDLSECDLVLNLPHADQLLLIRLGPDGLTGGDLDAAHF